MDKQQLASTVNKVLDEMRQRPIPIGISSRHIHLAAADYARLFSRAAHPAKAAASRTICCRADGDPGWPQRAIKQRAPARPFAPDQPGGNLTHRRPDPRYRRAAAHVRQSAGHAGISLISPSAELELSGGTIVAQRHIHMSPLDALILRVSHGDSVAVAIEGSDRRLIFDNVAVRVAPDMRLEMHIDTDEANAAGADAAQAWATLVTKP